MLLESFPRGPCRLPNVLPITLHSITLMLVNYCIFLCDVVLALGDHQKVSDGVSSFEVHLAAHLTANVLKSFTHPFDAWHHHVDVVVLL